LRLRGIRAAILDLEGTMVDTLGDFEAAIHGAFTEAGWPFPPRAFIKGSIGLGTEHLLRACLQQAEVPATHLPAATAAYLRHYHVVNGRHSHVYPGVVEGLRALAGLGVRLACLTNKPTALALPLLQAKGLAPFFDHVFGGDAFAQKKPHPEPVLRCCQALGTAPAATVVIGDSRHDAEAARAAGCPVLLLSGGYNHGQPVQAAEPDAVMATLDEAAAWLSAA
jgi:phosphoglycolate phosphatase